MPLQSMSSEKPPEGIDNLPAIYQYLLKESASHGDSDITPYQYDRFIDLWEKTKEFRCIQVNCNAHLPSTSIKGKFDHRLMMPSTLPQQARGDFYSELMGSAVAMSVGELLWMFVTKNGVLPVLEIATPLQSVKDALARKEVKQPWISLYLPTCAAYFFENYNLDLDKPRLIGWADELSAADYQLNMADSPCESLVPQASKLYQTVNTKAKVPSLFSFPFYFYAHNAEIVVGYIKTGEVWKALTMNGLDISEKTYKILFSGENDFGEAVRRTVEIFRPSFLEKTADATTIRDGRRIHKGHRKARIAHLKAIGGYSCAQAAISITHSLAIRDTQDKTRFLSRASNFLTALITIPKCELAKIDVKAAAIANRRNGIGSTSYDAQAYLCERMRHTTRDIWDNIAILKLPISRAMVNDEILKEVSARQEHVLAASQLNRINLPLQQSLIQIQTLQALFRKIDLTLSSSPLAVAMKHWQLIDPLFRQRTIGGVKIGKHAVPVTDHQSFSDINGSQSELTANGCAWLKGLWLTLASSGAKLDQFFVKNLQFCNTFAEISKMSVGEGNQIFARAKILLHQPLKDRGTHQKLHWLNLAAATGKEITVKSSSHSITYQLSNQVDELSLFEGFCRLQVRNEDGRSGRRSA